ncbi:MAG: NYN domain-containing protein [Paludibacteraceae bacterium]|nr:NYN domain-containing protein [Paludibacteraceae bacterium]MBR4840632.1 NYN domain-containing protein [Paludibacteraceae bacterium]
MREKTDLRLAVLIDADNIPYSCVKDMLDEVAKSGIPTIKRIYGDWTRPALNGWKPLLLENAITPIQQYGYTTGKNSTDSAMIIDAMDILHSQKVDGFCLASSDSDFTRLATRLRESGMFVLGIGEKKTPKPFIVACDKFTYIEVIRPGNAEAGTPNKSADQAKQKGEPLAVGSDIVKLLKNTIDDLADDNGWASLAEVGSMINKIRPDFDPRIYGFWKLTPLIKSLPHFEIDERETEYSKVRHIYVRNKKAVAPSKRGRRIKSNT